MKQFIITKQLFNRFHLFNYKTFKESFLTSLKQGLISFFALLLSLGLFEFIKGVIQGKPTVTLDKLDFAIAFLGFLLMFAAKLIERYYGKH